MALFKERIKHISEKYERHISSLALVLGFVLDNLTFQRIDFWVSNAFLFFYLVLGMLGIVFTNLYDAGKIRGNVVERIYPWIVVVMQYAFGGLFSGYFIFYSRSGSFAASWLFILILVVLMVGNELFKTRYLRFRFQINILYITLFAFTIFYVPILVGSLGAKIFLVSGLASLCVVAIFLYVLYLIVPVVVRENVKFLMMSIMVIYMSINVMYFTNIIPPIPLALQEARAVHSLEKTSGGDYRITYEQMPWYDVYTTYYMPTYHLVAGEPVTFYSSVFSPTSINTNIIHRWQYYDEKTGKWVEALYLKFPIVGGRGGGYRGYSIKENVFPGKWRVDVMTERGQLIGRYRFEVVSSPSATNLRTEVR